MSDFTQTKKKRGLRVSLLLYYYIVRRHLETILDNLGEHILDIITEGNKLNLLEINTTPGMTATSFIPQQVRAAGLDIKDVLTEIIEDSF